MNIGTFHAICLGLLKDVKLLGPSEALELAGQVLRRQGSRPPGLEQAVLEVVDILKFIHKDMEELLLPGRVKLEGFYEKAVEVQNPVFCKRPTAFPRRSASPRKFSA